MNRNRRACWFYICLGCCSALALIQFVNLRQAGDSPPPEPSTIPDWNEPIPYVNYTARGAAIKRLSGYHGKRYDRLINLMQHIPKTGGTSLWKFLEKIRPELCPDCVLWNHYVGRMNLTWSTYAALDMCETERIVPPHQPDSNAVTIFTLFRDPTHHVLSQYFHCTESQFKRKARDMPSLEDWLDFWIHVRANKTIMQETDLLFLYEPFRCYRPINMQTHFTGGITSVKDLQEQYFALGLTSEMKRSSCLVATRFFGKLPDACNCSKQNRSTITVGRQDHRVEHHGDSYNLTVSQQAKIATLTEKDRVLWHNAQLVFWQQIRQLEEEFEVEICSD